MNIKRIGKRYSLIVLFLTFLFLNGCHKEQEKQYRIGVLNGFPPFAAIINGLKDELSKNEIVEGKNIEYDIQQSAMNPEVERQILKKFVEDEVDLIFAFATEAAIAAKAATKGTNIPVVFAHAGLDGNDLVETMRQPGGNITGTRFSGVDNSIKRFELLLRIVPTAKSVYVTYNRNYPTNIHSIGPLRSFAKSKGVTLIEDPLSNVTEIETNLAKRGSAKNTGIDAIFIMPDDFSQSLRGWKQIIRFADRNRIPIGGAIQFTADAGALFSYVPVFYDVGRLAASLVIKVLNGMPAGTIPVATPEEELRLNYKKATDLGIEIPEDLLRQAKEILR